MTTEQKIELASDRTLYESICMKVRTTPKKYRIALISGMTTT